MNSPNKTNRWDQTMRVFFWKENKGVSFWCKHIFFVSQFDLNKPPVEFAAANERSAKDLFEILLKGIFG
jgi:hypothetical protein